MYFFETRYGHGSGWVGLGIELFLVGWVGLGSGSDGLGWVGSPKMDPCPPPLLVLTFFMSDFVNTIIASTIIHQNCVQTNNIHLGSSSQKIHP